MSDRWPGRGDDREAGGGRLTAVVVVLSLIWVVRTGHVGAQMTWGREGGGASAGNLRPPGQGGVPSAQH